MGKAELLQQIEDLAAQKLITKEEVNVAYNEGAAVKTDQALTRKLGISEILYYLGGAIVFLGIAILVYQNWTTLNFSTRLLATLGAGIAAYFVGVIFSRDENLEPVGQSFYLISALVIPIGLAVIFDNTGFEVGTAATQSLISFILFGTYLLSFSVFRKTIFILFDIIFGTWLFFSFTANLIGGSPYFGAEFWEYRILITGITYLLLGYFFSQDEKEALAGPLYGFGVLAFLGSALALGGWSPNQNAFWELIFPGLVFGIIFLSIHVKSKSFLTFGSMFLMAYILKITSEYFSQGLGWPLALVLAGLTLVGVGYFAFYLNRKYLTLRE